jgi:hypothetical protein
MGSGFAASRRPGTTSHEADASLAAYRFGACLKYLRSGSAWSFLVGIKSPSPLRKYASVPMTT